MSVPRSGSPLVATLAMMGVSAVANTARINGFRTGEVSDRLPTGFTPAGFTFSIWSVIYLALVAFAIAQLFGSPAVRRRGDRVRRLFVVSAVANVAWIFAWHHLYIGASFAIMLGLLGCLLLVRRELGRVPAASRAERWLVDAPFALYAGWITTATIANLGALLSARQAYPLGLGMEGWALVSVGAAVAIYAVVAWKSRDAIFPSVFLWAALGIALKPHGVPTSVRVVASAGAALVAVTMFVGVLRRTGALASGTRAPS